MSSFVSLEDVKKIYQMGEVQIMAAAGIDFSICCIVRGLFCGTIPGTGRIQDADQYRDPADLYRNRMAGQSYLCICQ